MTASGCWRAGSVRTLTSLLPIELDEDDKRLLTEVGLPTTMPSNLFRADQLDQVSMARVAYGSRHLLRLGADLGTAICLDLETGSVVSVDPSGEHPERFVNSNLDSFQRFLCRVELFYAGCEGLDDTAVFAGIASLTSDLDRADRAALRDPENWWAVLIEQMRDGLL